MFCFHRWNVISAKPFLFQDTSFGYSEHGWSNMTHILYKCSKCGKLKTKDMSGTWNLKEVQ